MRLLVLLVFSAISPMSAISPIRPISAISPIAVFSNVRWTVGNQEGWLGKRVSATQSFQGTASYRCSFPTSFGPT